MSSRILSRTAPALIAAVSLIGTHAAIAQRGSVSVPEDTVVKLKLDSHLSSKTAHRGEHFAAVLQNDDRSGFPEGTRVQGTITNVQRYSSKDHPGMLDVEFRDAYLPDGQRVSIDGRLASLADDDVQRKDDGRLVSRRGGGKKPDWKWAGYGAGAGLVLSAIFGGNPLKGILLGGVGGAAYGYLNKKGGGKGKARDVDLPRGTEFGMQLMDRVAFQDRGNYNYYSRTAGYRDSDRNGARNGDRIDARNGDRNDTRNDARNGDRDLRSATAMVNGRTVQFDTARPHRVGSVSFYPIAPIADAANMNLDWRRGDRDFSITTADGRLEGRVGERDLTRDGRRVFTLQDAPMLEDGELFVPREFLDRAGFETRFNKDRNRWEIETRR